MEPEPEPEPEPELEPEPAQRLYWFGRHPLQPEWKNPLARIHSPRGACGPLAGASLAELGFVELDLQGDGVVAAPPAMTWCDRHTARGYEGVAGRGVLLKQLPSAWMDTLDDKRSMHLLLAEQSAAGALRLPQTFLGEDFVAAGGVPVGSSADDTEGDGGTWYVKHARGIKGKQVERHVTAAAACAALRALPVAIEGLDPWRHPNDTPTQSDHVVQREVRPLLLGDRRFCLRQHVLLVLPPSSPSSSSSCSSEAVPLVPRGFSHRDVIVMPHSAPDGSDGKAAHIQQVGKGHPTPTLLDNADPARSSTLQATQLAIPGVDPARATEQLECLARAVLDSFCRVAVPEEPRDGNSKRHFLQCMFKTIILPRQARDKHGNTGENPHRKTLYFAGWLYNVFGFDVVFEGPSADAVLLEVNVFPAIAGGTMSAVPREVYARLVDDTLRLLAPVLDSGCAGGAGAGECSLGADLGGYADLGLTCTPT
jgi:hypothetical protein